MAGLAFTVAAACDNAPDPLPSPTSILVAVAVPPDSPATELRLDVVDVGSGRRHTVATSPQGWSAVSWSPDGRHLAAIEGRDILHVFERESWADRTVALSGLAVSVSWAPDSSRFVVIGTPLVQYRADLTELARFDGPPSRPQGPDAPGGFSATAWWSPAGAVATELDGRLVILWPDGSADIVALPDGLPVAQTAGWRDADTLVVSGGYPPQPHTYDVALAKGRASWTMLSGSVTIDPEYDLASQRMSRRHPGMPILGGGLSADGRAAVAQVLPGYDVEPATHFDAEFDLAGVVSSTDLGARGFNGPMALLLRIDWDVVVIGEGGKPLQNHQLPPSE